MRRKTAIATDRRYNLTALPLPVLRPTRSATRTDRHGDAVITNLGKGYLWSGEGDVPGLGQRVTVRMNRLGEGTVVGYLVEYGWLGVKVQLDAPPDWHRRQNPGEPWALVFGAELAPQGADPERVSDECPECSRVGAGPLCKAHRAPGGGQ